MLRPFLCHESEQQSTVTLYSRPFLRHESGLRYTATLYFRPVFIHEREQVAIDVHTSLAVPYGYSALARRVCEIDYLSPYLSRFVLLTALCTVDLKRSLDHRAIMSPMLTMNAPWGGGQGREEGARERPA